MRKVTIAAILLSLLWTVPLAAQQLGGGVTIFIPESSWLGNGSVSYEAKLETSMGLGGLMSLPVGVAYDKVYGMLPQGTGFDGASSPWAIADSFILFTGLRITIPVSVLFIQAEAGGVAQWNAGLLPLESNIAASFAPAGTIWALRSVKMVAPFGYGFYAGGSVGVDVKNVRIALAAGYRRTISPLTLTGSYYQIDTSTSGVTATGPIPDSGAVLRLAGVYVGLTGTVSF